jgi:hypothetical protein
MFNKYFCVFVIETIDYLRAAHYFITELGQAGTGGT